MNTLSIDNLIALKYPGYFYDPETEILYSNKIKGELRPLHKYEANRFNRIDHLCGSKWAYRISDNGRARFLTEHHLKHKLDSIRGKDMKHTVITTHPATRDKIEEKPKTYHYGDCFLTEEGVHQIVLCAPFTVALIKLTLENRRVNTIFVNSVSAITEEDLQRMKGTLKELQLLSKVEIRYEE